MINQLKKIKNLYQFIFISMLILLFSCSVEKNNKTDQSLNDKGQPVYIDRPFVQDFSIKYYIEGETSPKELKAVSADRDGNIRLLTEKGIFLPDNGSFYYPGKLTPDIMYQPMLKKNVKAITTYENQTVYLDEKQVFSNAWAGKIQIDHGLPGAILFIGGEDFHFLVSDGIQLAYLDKDGKQIWKAEFPGLKEIKYDTTGDRFILISVNTVATASSTGNIQTVYDGENITCAEPLLESENIVIGTSAGYLILPSKEIINNVPCPEINCIRQIDGELWFGTNQGAFRLNKDKTYCYYAAERWLPGNKVTAMEQGPENSILVCTDKGLGRIIHKEMTLEEKALFYEKQVREKNIRYGFNCSSVQMPNGYSSAISGPQPSDNLWTGMYLAGQLFRYKVTGDTGAKQNAFEAFEAMERLHTVTGIKGLFARSFERDYKTENTKTPGWRERELHSGSPATIWLPCKDQPNWTFRSTASSDQTVGQIFALTAILELSDDEAWKKRALTMLDNMMNYIVDNDLYIIDVDGEPTMWGKWNADYVNSFPTNVGDRKINSSNIIAFLQTAYKFTGNEKYKQKAFEMMEKYGYLENLMRPMAEIGKSDSTQSEWAKTLSHEWNHSDDEMYFLAYWGLFPYAFSPELKEKFKEAIRDHWEIERPEKNALWNLTYAMTGAKDFDLDESIGFLQQYPLDMRNWSVQNSNRKDIELIPANFRNQSTKTLLPLSEMPLYRHNGDIFRLDSQGDGSSLISAGDVWLLPYWMGRYLGVISAPSEN